MENNESVVVESKFKKNLKSIFNKRKISNAFTYLMIIAMIVVFSLWSIGWDPRKIGWSVFLVNLAILVFIAVVAIFLGESEGESFFKSLITGAYQASREIYLKILDKVIVRGYTDMLPEYLSWRYEKDYTYACYQLLTSKEIKNKRILDLTDDEVESLRYEPIKKVWEEDSLYPNKVDYFSKLSEEQYLVVVAIRKGQVKVDYIEDYNYYLTDSVGEESEQLVTRIKNTEKRKLKILWRERASKLILLFLFSIIGAGIFFDEQGEGEHAQAIGNLVQRLSVFATSFFAGFNAKRITNQADVVVLKHKTRYLEVFVTSIEKGHFVPTDYEEQARLDYEKHEKEKKAAAEKVIIPEVVQENKLLGNQKSEV